MIAAIYESVIRPELYDAFITAWGDHIQAALDLNSSDSGPDLDLDPELQAHFARAYEILEQIGRKTPQAGLAEQVEAAGGFALLAEPDGQILAVSRNAAKLLDGRRRLAALSDVLTANSVELLEQLAQAAADQPTDQPAVVLSTGIAPRHLIARIAWIPGSGGQGRTALVIESLDYHWGERAEHMLVASFGLSRAEVDVVRNLMAGHSLREIAEQSGRSEHTIRNQAKAVLAKTGAPGQVDLIRLVAYLLNQQSPDAAAARSGPGLPFQMLTMSSGLQMQVFQFGARLGRPVIFLHGMLDGTAPLRFLDREFERRGLRVIAPARPGFGLSDAVTRTEQALEVFVAHLDELIDIQKLKRPILLGHLAGALSGHVLASRLQHRLAGMVAVSGGAPILRRAQLSTMPPRQRAVAYTARYAPALLPAVLRAGIAQIDGKDIKGFMTALYPPGSHDNAVIQRLDLAPLIQEGYRFSVQQGHAGFMTDSHFVVRDWSDHIANQPAPIIYLNGELDPVISAPAVAEFMSGRAGVDVRVLPGIGQLLLYERPDIVFDAVDEIFALSKG